MAFDTILIANRGEIACRIIRATRALGLRSIAVYTDADALSPHVTLADDAVRIGAGPVGESYLSVDAILDAARIGGAQAIHPGYGFLSENADFARAVRDAGQVFIGPPASAIQIMGDKARAKRAMIAAGVPCVPGYQGDDQTDARLIAEADAIGFPVMVKASAGGGGRGMRRVLEPRDLPAALIRARSESLAAFGSDRLILEKAIEAPRHVEIQVFADAHGACLHLGERDCSVQRRHQKVIEESPGPAMTAQLRAAMGQAAVCAARAVDYRGAGTVEFLLGRDGAFHFLEMNTRLQVEHPVTEMVTGYDLVALQISVARGDPLPMAQDEVALTGHAIEARLYAEDPTRDFLPSQGTIDAWEPASGPGLRVDAGIRAGQPVPPYYDPMLAKVIAWGESREIARQRLRAALENTVLIGPASNRAFLADILTQPAFVAGQATTDFVDQTYRDGLPPAPVGIEDVVLAAALWLHAHARRALEASLTRDERLLGLGGMQIRLDLCAGQDIHRLRATGDGTRWIISDGETAHETRIERRDGARAAVVLQGRRHALGCHIDDDGITITRGAETRRFSLHRPWERASSGDGSGVVQAPMPGLVVSLAVAAGDRVRRGQDLAVLEAMKMQHPLTATLDGTVAEVMTQPGAQVAAGAPLIRIDPD